MVIGGGLIYHWQLINPIPFRLDNKWLKAEGFRSLVARVWREESASGKGSFRVAKKLILLKMAIKNWVREERLKVKEGTNRLMDELEGLDCLEGDVGLSMEEGEMREVVGLELVNRMCMKEIFWRQKAKERWLKEGDRNTKYFHCLANHRRRCNNVDEIVIANICVSGNDNMREDAMNFFKQL